MFIGVFELIARLILLLIVLLSEVGVAPSVFAIAGNLFLALTISAAVFLIIGVQKVRILKLLFINMPSRILFFIETVRMGQSLVVR